MLRKPEYNIILLEPDFPIFFLNFCTVQNMSMWTELNTVCHESVTTGRALTLICFTTKLCMLGSPFLGLFTDITKAKLKFDTNHFQAVPFMFAHAVTRSYFHSNFVTVKAMLRLWILDLCKRSLDLKNSFYLLWQLLVLERPSCLRPWKLFCTFIGGSQKLPSGLKPVYRGNFYRPSMKLWEGNVFNCVCLSVCSKEAVLCDYYPWCIRPHHTGITLCLALVPLCTLTAHPSDLWWQKLETCSNLFTWGSPW